MSHQSFAISARLRPSRGSWLDRLHAAFALHRSRVRLAELDQHLLDDIGIDRRTAEKEAARPVWDAPDRWIC